MSANRHSPITVINCQQSANETHSNKAFIAEPHTSLDLCSSSSRDVHHSQSRDSSDSDDENDRQVLRALANNDDANDSCSSSSDSEELVEKSADGQELSRSPSGKSVTPGGSLRAPNHNKSLQASSASIIGRISSGLNAAFSGPSVLMRSPRVGVAPPDPGSRPESSCSTTRTPSPESFIWRPIKPGYVNTEAGLQSRTVVQQTVQVQQTESMSRDDSLKQYIAIMPMPLAVVCCALNFISPGLGTFVSGLSLLCCSQPQNPTAFRSDLVLMNSWLALLQMITVVFLLAGWIWSITWGLAFIEISRSFYTSRDTTTSEEAISGRHDDDNRAMATTTTTATTRTTTTTTMTTLSDAPDSNTGAGLPEPPIIVLQEPPLVMQPGIFSSGTAGWTTRAAHLPPVAQTMTSQPGGRRQQRYSQRRQTASQRAADHITGVLLRPETLEHIVIHSSVVPDPQFTSSSTSGATEMTHK